MAQLQITDNSQHNLKQSELVHKPDLDRIANVKIKDLALDGNPNLLVFPQDLNHYGDDISESCIISMRGNEISTGNIMGFVGVNDTQLDINSRFAKDCQHDYFLHYMLQKVFSINLFDIQHSISKEPVFDFMLYLFPYFLKKALVQGLFKKYRRFEYNDANIRGPIDISRHIRQNIPFKGAVAYTTREHSYDNEVTQLVRHTIEYIRTKEMGSAVLNSDLDTKNYVSQIVMATQTYNVRERVKVIHQNLRPIRHPYYSAYTDLQKICLQILRHESLKYGQEKDQVYGILFDGAWLWEEYLNTILKSIGFNHPENKKHKGGFRMFAKNSDDDAISKNSRWLYPDFWKNDFIMDAKYKHLNNGVGREDLYQVVTYMFCKQIKKGGYVYPYEKDENPVKYELHEDSYGEYIHVIPVYIPAHDNLQKFIEGMRSSEEKLIEAILSTVKKGEAFPHLSD